MPHIANPLLEKCPEANRSSFNEATSSAAGGSSTSVPDDLLLACDCHFHWYVAFTDTLPMSCPVIHYLSLCFQAGTPFLSRAFDAVKTHMMGINPRSKPVHNSCGAYS
jgi:hypothetical protein